MSRKYFFRSRFCLDRAFQKRPHLKARLRLARRDALLSVPNPPGGRNSDLAQYSITPSLHHSITPSLHHSITPSLRAAGFEDEDDDEDENEAPSAVYFMTAVLLRSKVSATLTMMTRPRILCWK